MPESGGATTQSGILYQNSIAALFLGRLCDVTPRPDYEQVTCVRVEAPEHVDDIVVKYADEHRTYTQAKENLAIGSDAWRTLWQSFDKQFHDSEFQGDKDQLILSIGSWHDDFKDLKELCQRAGTSKDYAEWQDRMTADQRVLLQKIKLNLPPESLPDADIFGFFKHIQIQIEPLESIERSIPIYMPATNRLPQELFRLLRDRVGGAARIRGSFTADHLRRSLKTEAPDLRFAAPLDVQELLDATKRCSALLRQHKSSIGNTGRHFQQVAIAEIVQWMELNGDEQNNLAMLLDRAGMGKTVAIRDVLIALEERGITTLAIKADQQLSGVNLLSQIPEKLGLPASPEQILERLSKLGRVAVLVDQIDALSLSLAHDQRALNVVLDLVARLRRISNVRILLSCRVFDRDTDPRLKGIQVGREFTLQLLAEDNVRDILFRANVEYEILSDATKSLLRVPLHLDLFMLAAEGGPITVEQARGMVFLQELYNLIWQNIVLRTEVDGPAQSDRVAVLDLLTDYMNREQTTSAPLSLLQTHELQHLEKAANWLASAGILLRGGTGWNLLHQTFLDYCYAHRFAEGGGDIVEAVVASPQGLFDRRKLVQVISYLRGTWHQRYLHDLQRLLNSDRLRFHLHDILLRWFGGLPDPTDEEWLLGQRMLLNPTQRSRALGAMSGNPGWFHRLAETLLPRWLEDDAIIDLDITPYLMSMANVAQVEVVRIIGPYLGRSDLWNNRIRRILSGIRKWQTVEAAELFERTVYQVPSLTQFGRYELGIVAKAYPKVGCRLVRFVLAPATVGGYYARLESLETGTLDEAIRYVGREEPKLFVETIIPWLEQVLQAREAPIDQHLDHYLRDELAGNWYVTIYRVEAAIKSSLIAALIDLSKSETIYFKEIAARLAGLPNQTPQLLLTHVYRSVPEAYASDAFDFLTADQRRLDLGEVDQYDTRQLVKAVYPFLSDAQRTKLEAHIFAYAPIYKHLGLRALRMRGIEQLYLLQAIPVEHLTSRGIRRLREWERKFPGRRASDDPRTIRGGAVGSPIPEEIARRMSDRDWLRAMRKYERGVTHKDFLKGGARELANVMTGLIKENPERFHRLIQGVSEDVDDAYVDAFINGFAESSAPAEWLFETVRCFGQQNGRDVRRTIAWALAKRATADIPADIVTMLEGWVHGPIGEDESWWSKGESHGDAYESYMNSDRGSAFHTLMRIYDVQRGDEALDHKWSLIEHAASDESTALRAGAIHELIYMIQHNHERAISSFEQLTRDNLVLIELHYTREFLYWAFNKNFLRLCPYIIQMMNSEKENVQNQGAQLACIASLSTRAMESPEAEESARQLAEQAINGPAAWRRGATFIYAHNVTRCPTDSCMEKVIQLLDDSDSEVQQSISSTFLSWGAADFFPLRPFIDAYAASDGNLSYEFTKYLSEYGLLDPVWTLATIQTILNNLHPDSEVRWFTGVDELTRLVIRIYMDPTAGNDLRTDAMNVFDALMRQYAGQVQGVLAEWDSR